MTTRANVEPTWTWGSSAAMHLTQSSGSRSSAQLAQVTLPEPAVCSLYLQASALISDPANAFIDLFTINLHQGLGRVTVPRQITFAGQPSSLAPLEWTVPFVPLHSLNVDVEVKASFLNPLPTVDIQIYFVISPITRIPQQIQKLQFGMATPGEADSLDDELLENLEGEAPSVAEIMGQEAHERVQGDAGDDDDGGDEPEAVPAWMMDLVDALSARLGRAPKRGELRAAVERMRERQARKAR